MKNEAIAATESPAEFQVWLDALPQLVELFQAQGMPTAETVANSAQLLLQVKLGHTCIDTWRKTQGKPYGAAKRATDGHYTPALQVLEHLEGKLKDYIATLAGAREAQRQTAIQSGKTPPAPLEVPGVTLSQRMAWKELNIELVPEEFTKKEIDWDKVKAHAKAHEEAGTDCFIPGIKFSTKFQVSASTKGAAK